MGDHTAHGGVDPDDEDSTAAAPEAGVWPANSDERRHERDGGSPTVQAEVAGAEIEVAHSATAEARPLRNLLVVAAGLLTLLAVNGHSPAGGRSLATSDPADYVEVTVPTVSTLPALPTVVDEAGSGQPSRSAATSPTAPTASEQATTIVSDPAADAATTSVAPASAPPVPVAVESAPPAGTDDDTVSRVIPAEAAVEPAPVVSPWQDKSTITPAGYVATDVGCASGTSASSLDAFFRDRIGPVMGLDYQHVYALGGKRYLWLFQDAFVDYSGTAANLAQGAFVHNVAMVQDGSCFTLMHQGSIAAPTAFELGTGGNPIAKWFWPMGGQTFGNRTYVFWAQMERDGYDPKGANGLGWHPVRTWIATYDASSLGRLSFTPAADSGVTPIYGYAVDSDDQYTYLFGNSFEQNLVREGGYANGPHSGTSMYLARVPVASFGSAPEYWADGTWTADAAQATPVSHRYWVENPMQPRRINGQWVSATKLDGYWGDELVIDVANDPWGPWTTVEQRALAPRGGDPLMNTYQAHLMPWLSGGSLVVSVSNNARNMYRDAWPRPDRYRPMFFGAALVAPPPPEEVTTTVEETTTTVVESTTSDVETTTTSTTSTIPSGTTTSVPESSSTSSTSTTSTTAPPGSTSTTTTTTAPSAPTDPPDESSSSSSTTTTLPPCAPPDGSGGSTTTTDPKDPPDCVPDESTTSTSAPAP